MDVLKMSSLTSKDIENLIERFKSRKPTAVKFPISEVEWKIFREFDRFDENVYAVMKPFDIDVFEIGE